MATSAVSTSSQRPEVPRLQIAAVSAVVALAHAWPLWQQGVNNWNHDLYSFFPLIILGSGLIAWQRWSELSEREILWGRGPIPYVSGLLCLALLAFSLRMHSPWPGALSAIIALRATLRWALGVKAARQLAPVWWFLILGLPLPLGADRELVVWLQLQASQVASGVLDLINYRHAISGVFLRFPGHTFEVEDACSGIQSLYAAISCVALYSILSRRSALRTLVMLLVATFWVLVANVARIVFVCVAVIKWGLPVSSGFGHELVGIGAFVAAMLMSASTDRFLLFLIPPTDPNAEFAGKSRLTSRLRRWFRSSDKEQEDIRPSGKVSWPGLIFGGVLLVGFGLLAAAQLPAMFSARTRWFENLDPDRFQVEVDFFPAQFRGWTMVHFEELRRSSSSQFGETSRIWTYDRGGVRVQLSIDGPFSAWHDLAHCYGSLGWKTIEEEDHFATEYPYTHFLQELAGNDRQRLDESAASEPGRFDQQMFVQFATFSETGRNIPPPPLVRWGLGRRFPQLTTVVSRLIQQARAGTAEAPERGAVYQLQLVYRTEGMITQSEREAAREFFREMHRLTLDAMQKRADAGSPQVGLSEP